MCVLESSFRTDRPFNSLCSFQILRNGLPHPSRVSEALSKSKLIARQREKMQFSSPAFELKKFTLGSHSVLKMSAAGKYNKRSGIN